MAGLSPCLSALSVRTSYMVVMLEAGRLMRPSLALKCLYGFVSPSTSGAPGASTINGGF